ncbi:flagellar export chaperone FliS [Brevibacillus borstelensis]|jgi:flagellar protein FliS|uniref:flagellar export chaperone FliS n=1 Tax=Brevibacillus borstelensis TaxID=45462 RepID=UPI002E1BB3A8|nr:flagellar export chaperone FliS [Brevibacillus borstelensis]MED1872997.1 flagellar export chaperone FliS [Brevibacillus borstelensis]
MLQTTAQNTYKQNQVGTATPQDLTLMLYEGGIKFIKRAKHSIQEKDFNTAHDLITRVQDIISELIITLDRKYPVAEQMLLLYDFMKNRLIEANIKKDIAALEEVEEFFVEFRDTWKQAMQIARSQQPQQK